MSVRLRDTMVMLGLLASALIHQVGAWQARSLSRLAHNVRLSDPPRLLVHLQHHTLNGFGVGDSMS